MICTTLHLALRACACWGAAPLRLRPIASRRPQYFFQDYVAQGRDSFASLYTVTQHAGHVLPRIYLMVVCACCAMRAEPSTVPFYLNDLLEFAKGIQNPMRGLFLRSFLGSSVRPLLPDKRPGAMRLLCLLAPLCTTALKRPVSRPIKPRASRSVHA
jgi:Vacuolar protein sorting-associated protein 35